MRLSSAFPAAPPMDRQDVAKLVMELMQGHEETLGAHSPAPRAMVKLPARHWRDFAPGGALFAILRRCLREKHAKSLRRFDWQSDHKRAEFIEMMSRCLQDLRDKGVVRRGQGVPRRTCPRMSRGVPRRRGRHGHRPRRRARRGGRHARHLPRHFPRRLPDADERPPVVLGVVGKRRRAVSSPSRFLRPVALRLRRDVERRAQPEPARHRRTRTKLATRSDWRPAPPRASRALARGFEAIQRMEAARRITRGRTPPARGRAARAAAARETAARRRTRCSRERRDTSRAWERPRPGRLRVRSVAGRTRTARRRLVDRRRALHSREAADGGAAPRGGDSGGERRRLAPPQTAALLGSIPNVPSSRGASAGVARRAGEHHAGTVPRAARRASPPPPPSPMPPRKRSRTRRQTRHPDRRHPGKRRHPENDGTLVPGHAAWFRASPEVATLRRTPRPRIFRGDCHRAYVAVRDAMILGDRAFVARGGDDSRGRARVRVRGVIGVRADAETAAAVRLFVVGLIGWNGETAGWWRRRR